MLADNKPGSVTPPTLKRMFAPMEDTLLCRNVVKCFSSQRNCRALEPEFLGSILTLLLTCFITLETLLSRSICLT